MKHTDTINNLIISRKIADDQLCRKTWKSLRAYKDSHNNNDVRWNYAHILKTTWPGAQPKDYVKNKMPLYIEIESQRYYLDYGKGQNKISNIYNDLFIENPELAYEYKMYHTPENDHFPIPKSKGGICEYNNLQCVPKYANISSQDVDLDSIIESYKLAQQVYIDIRKKLDISLS